MELDADEDFFLGRSNTGLFQVPENVTRAFLQLLRGWSPGKQLDFVPAGEEPATIAVVDSSRCWAADWLQLLGGSREPADDA